MFLSCLRSVVVLDTELSKRFLKSLRTNLKDLNTNLWCQPVPTFFGWLHVVIYTKQKFFNIRQASFNVAVLPIYESDLKYRRRQRVSNATETSARIWRPNAELRETATPSLPYE